MTYRNLSTKNKGSHPLGSLRTISFVFILLSSLLIVGSCAATAVTVPAATDIETVPISGAFQLSALISGSVVPSTQGYSQRNVFVEVDSNGIPTTTTSALNIGYDISLVARNPTPGSSATLSAATLYYTTSTILQTSITPSASSLKTITMSQIVDDSSTTASPTVTFMAQAVPITSQDVVQFFFSSLQPSVSTTAQKSSWFQYDLTATLPTNTSTSSTPLNIPSLECSQCFAICPTEPDSSTTTTTTTSTSLVKPQIITDEDIEACWTQCCPDEETAVVNWFNNLINLNPVLQQAVFPSSLPSLPSSPSSSSSLPSLPTPGQLITPSSFLPFASNSAKHAQTLQFTTLDGALHTVGLDPEATLDQLVNVSSLASSLPVIVSPLQNASSVAQFTNATALLSALLPPSALASSVSSSPVTNPILSIPTTTTTTSTSNASALPTAPILSPTSILTFLNDLAETQPTANLPGLFPNLVSSTVPQPTSLVIPILPVTPAVPTTTVSSLATGSHSDRTMHTQQLTSSSIAGLGTALDKLTSTGILNASSTTETLSSLPQSISNSMCLEASCYSSCLGAAASTGLGAASALSNSGLPAPSLPTVDSSLTPVSPPSGIVSTPSLPTASNLPTIPSLPSPSSLASSSSSSLPSPQTLSGMQLTPAVINAAMPTITSQLTNLTSAVGSGANNVSDIAGCISACQTACQSGLTSDDSVDCSSGGSGLTNTLQCMGSWLDNIQGTQSQLGSTAASAATGLQSVADSLSNQLSLPSGISLFGLRHNNNNAGQKHRIMSATTVSSNNNVSTKSDGVLNVPFANFTSFHDLLQSNGQKRAQVLQAALDSSTLTARIVQASANSTSSSSAQQIQSTFSAYPKQQTVSTLAQQQTNNVQTEATSFFASLPTTASQLHPGLAIADKLVALKNKL